jgi:hypothetical protein
VHKAVFIISRLLLLLLQPRLLYALHVAATGVAF